MEATITVESANFTNALRNLRRYVGAEAERLIKNESRLLVREFMNRTPPFDMKKKGGISGLSGNAQRIGEKAVARDINYLVKGFDSGFLQSLQDWYGTTITDRVFTRKDGTDWLIDRTTITRSVGTIKQFHKSKRSRRRGNVPMAVSRRQSIDIGRHTSRDKIFTTHKVKSDYIKSKQANVGIGASGWNAAARALKAPIPKWIKRHGYGYGFFSQTGMGTNKYRITMGSNVSYFPNYKERVVVPAMNQRARAIGGKVRQVIKHGTERYRFAKGI